MIFSLIFTWWLKINFKYKYESLGHIKGIECFNSTWEGEGSGLSMGRKMDFHARRMENMVGMNRDNGG